MKFIRTTVFIVFRLIARFRLSRLGAWLLAMTSRRLTLERNNAGAQKRYRALVMQRTGFLQDAEESFRDGGDFEVISWPNMALKAFALEILDRSLDHNNYISDDPKITASKLAYRRFLSDLWRHFNRIRPVDVVLTGNFAYFTEREFGVALEQAGTPFIALHKENVRPPRRVNEYWHSLYKNRRGPFDGRRILVYNDIERELEISSGVAGPNNVTVTGMPRLDKYHRWRTDHAGPVTGQKPRVLFFAFARNDKLTAIHRKPSAGIAGDIEAMGGWGDLSWGKYALETHRAMIELARENPDVEVIVKSKGQSRKLSDILEMLSGIKGGLPSNVTVVSGGDPFDLLARCQVVVGFNTTGLLEALATGKPTIVPRFAEAADPAMQDLIIDLGNAPLHPESPQALKEMVVRHTRNPQPIPAALSADTARMLRYWVGNDDGLAGRRVVDVLRREIESARAS
jgi:hypothetical protein